MAVGYYFLFFFLPCSCHCVCLKKQAFDRQQGETVAGQPNMESAFGLALEKRGVISHGRPVGLVMQARERYPSW